MNNYEFILRLLTIIFFFSTISISIAYYLQFKKPLALHFSGLFLGLVTLLLGEYITFIDSYITFIDSYITGIWFNNGAFIFYVLTTPSYLLITYFGISFIQSLKRRSLYNPVKVVVITIMFILTLLEELSVLNEKFLIIPIIITFIYMFVSILLLCINSEDGFFKKSFRLFFIELFVIIVMLFLIYFRVFTDIALVLIYIQSLIISIQTMFFSFKFFSKKPYLKDGEITDSCITKFKLTKREVEVLYLIITGAKNQYIADELCVSLRTITTHVSNIYIKLSVKNRVQVLNLFNKNWARS